MTAPLPPGATRETISGDFLTPAYRLTGKIAVGHAGLLRLLNDPSSSLIELRDAYLSRVNQPGKILTHFSLVRLAKARVELVLLGRREDVGPLGVARDGFARIEHPVLAATLAFEVHGTLEHPAGRLDVSSLLVEGGSKFFLLHRATIVALAAPEVQFTAVAVLVNRARVDLFSAHGEEL